MTRRIHKFWGNIYKLRVNGLLFGKLSPSFFGGGMGGGITAMGPLSL